MALPLITNLIYRNIKTTDVMKSFKKDLLREFPELNSDDINLRPIDLDNDGSFRLSVRCHDQWGTNFDINVVTKIKQLRQELYAYRFDAQDRSNDYAFKAITSYGGNQILQSQFSQSPIDAVSDLIYHAYPNKDAFQKLALHKPIHTKRYQRDYQNQEYASQNSLNNFNQKNNYQSNSQNSSQNKETIWDDIYHMFF